MTSAELLRRGRLFNAGYAAVLAACLWKFVAVVIIGFDLFLAGIACWPDLHVTLPEAARWAEYAQAHDNRLPPDGRERLRSIDERWGSIVAHFQRERDGHVLILISTFVPLAALGCLVLLAIRAYVFEGLKARRILPASQVKLEILLEEARAALPSGFPPVALRLARSTFIRYRFRHGLTAYLQDSLLARLRRGRMGEFRFVLMHELFHVRCGDPILNALTRPLARLLVVFVAISVFFPFGSWPRPLRVPVLLNLALAAVTAIVVFRLLRRIDDSFRLHKESLADTYAAMETPGVDLAQVYQSSPAGGSHLSAEQRIGFLRTGRTATPAQLFLRIQVLSAYCMAIWTAGPPDQILGPKLPLLEYPAYWIAAFGLLLLTVETWQNPIPAAFRWGLLSGAALALAACAFIARQSVVFPEYFYAQIVVVGVAAGRLAAQRSIWKRVGSDRIQRVAIARGEGRQWVAMLHALASWIALFFCAVATLQYFFYVAGIGVFGGELPRGFSSSFDLRSDFSSIGSITLMLVVIAAARNLKRPWIPALFAEWLWFWAVLIHYAALFWLWLSDLFPGRTYGELLTAFTRMPWQDQQRLELYGPINVDLRRVMVATAIPQVLIALLYISRIRNALVAQRRSEASR